MHALRLPLRIPAVTILFTGTLLSTGAPAPHPPAGTPATDALYRIDARTPAGLRMLFAAGGPLPMVSAHRGGVADGVPENSLAAFAHTLRHTFAVMEVDPRYTKDGQIVLHHDATLDRTTTGKGAVINHTLAELKDLRLKDPSGRVTTETIPTLDEALEWARGRTVLILDHKDVPLEARVRKITEHKAEAHAMVIVYSFKEAQACHELNPNIMMEVMIPDRGKADEFERTGVPWNRVVAFVGHAAPADPAIFVLVHRRGARCIVGTSRNLDRRLLRAPPASLDTVAHDYRALRTQGADLLETDLPVRVGRLLQAGEEIPIPSVPGLIPPDRAGTTVPPIR